MSWDSPEYKLRKQKTFSPPDVQLKDVNAAVPKHLFERKLTTCLYYVVRDISLIAAFYALATQIDPAVTMLSTASSLGKWTTFTIRWTSWISYWIWQSFAFSGLWLLGHDFGHDSLSSSDAVNTVLGLVVHSILLTPYHFFRNVHRSHHKGTNNLDRDPTFRPATRETFHLSAQHVATAMDYHELLEDTPVYNLYKLLVAQFLGFQLKMIELRKSNGEYPPGTKHKPTAYLFQPVDVKGIILSDVGIGTIIYLLGWWIHKTSLAYVAKMYIAPWLITNNWLVMITFLQHSDPTIPHYRGQWTFARGALATVDRPILGWVGRFFMHNICHDHVAHHFFSTIPFYNLPQVTEAIKPVLGEHYYYDTTPILYALWRSWTHCKFIESEGDIVFYKDTHGQLLRESAGVD